MILKYLFYNFGDRQPSAVSLTFALYLQLCLFNNYYRKYLFFVIYQKSIQILFEFNKILCGKNNYLFKFYIIFFKEN